MTRKWFVLFALFLLSGCAGQMIPNSNLNPSQFNYTFDYSVVSNDEAIIKSEKMKNPFYVVTQENLTEYWKERAPSFILNNSNISNPDYFFKIELLAALVTKIRRSRVSLDEQFDSGAIFKLTVLDKKKSKIHERFFKINSLWVADGLSFKGPAKIARGLMPGEVNIKLGFDDIMEYIATGLFRKTESGDLIKISHSADNFKFRCEHLTPFVQNWLASKMIDDPQVKYRLPTCALLYFYYIMAEDISSLEELATTPCNVNGGQTISMVAKLAQDRSWPLFPEQLDTSSLPYKFE